MTGIPEIAPARGSEHIKALDGLRGLAILAVLMAHFGGGRHFSSLAFQIIGQTMVSGWMGVDLFFVLSGFLITGIILRSQHSTQFYKAFYARRALRIFPVYYFTLGVALVISLAAHMPWRLDQYSFFFFVNNIVIVFDNNIGTVGPSLYLAALWSLAVEEQFYLFWPFLMRNLGKHIYGMLGIIIVLALVLRITAVALNSPNAAYNLIFTRMDGLAFGALLAVLHEKGTLKTLPRFLPFALILCALTGIGIIGIVEKTLFWATPLMMTIGFDFTALLAFGLLWSVLAPGLPERIFSLKPMRFFGRYSYGIYIYHQILSIYFLSYIFPFYTRVFHNVGIAAAVYFVTCVAIVTAVAVVSFHVMELPILNMKRRFPYDGRSVSDT